MTTRAQWLEQLKDRIYISSDHGDGRYRPALKGPSLNGDGRIAFLPLDMPDEAMDALRDLAYEAYLVGHADGCASNAGGIEADSAAANAERLQVQRNRAVADIFAAQRAMRDAREKCRHVQSLRDLDTVLWNEFTDGLASLLGINVDDLNAWGDHPRAERQQRLRVLVIELREQQSQIDELRSAMRYAAILAGLCLAEISAGGFQRAEAACNRLRLALQEALDSAALPGSCASPSSVPSVASVPSVVKGRET